MAAPYPTDGPDPFADGAYPHNGQDPAAYSQGPEIPYPDPTFSRTDTSLSSDSLASEKKRLRMPRAPTRQAREVLKAAPDQQTEYMGMLLHMSLVIEKRPYWNIIAAASTWIMLAGFIVLPGTYQNFQDSDLIKAADEDPDLPSNVILSSIAKTPLVAVAATLSGLGALGIFGLWFKWKQNYVWMINKVILPAILNSTMGLLSTLVTVLSKEKKIFDTTAIGVTSITGGLVVFFICMFIWYNNFLLDAVKKDHEKAYGKVTVKEAIAQNNGPLPV